MASPGLLAGIGQGLQNAATGGVQTYNLIRGNQRADLLAVLQRRLLEEQLRQAGEKEKAITSLPSNLATLGRAMNPQAGPTQEIPLNTSEIPLGVDVPASVPASGPGGGGLLNALPQTMTFQPPAPARPRTTAELLSRPDIAQAYTGLLRAGVTPLGEGGAFLRPEEYAKQIKGEEDRQQAMQDLNEGWGLFGSSKDPKDQLTAMGKIYGAGVRLGKFPDQGPFFKFLENQQEVDAMKEASGALGPIVGRIASGKATPEDLVSVVQLGITSKSATIRSMAGPLITEMAKQHGPGILAATRFYEIQNAAPNTDPLTAWTQVKQEMPDAVARAEIDRHLPAAVAGAYAAHASGEAAGAAEKARDKNMSPLDRRIKEAQATNLENQPKRGDVLMDSQQKQYDSMYQGVMNKYQLGGPLFNIGGLQVPPPPQSTWDAAHRPDKLYQERYGSPKPSLQQIAIQRGEQILRANGHDPRDIAKIPQKVLKGVYTILEAEGLPIPGQAK